MEIRFKILLFFISLCSISMAQSYLKVKGVYMRNGLSYVKSTSYTIEGYPQSLSQNMQINGSVTINSILRTGNKEFYINSNSSASLVLGAEGKIIIEAGGSLKRKISGSSGFLFPITVSENNSINQTINSLNSFTFYKTSGSDANLSIQLSGNGNSLEIINTDASNTTTLEFDYNIDGGKNQRFKLIVNSGTITGIQAKDTITNIFKDVPSYLYTLSSTPANKISITSPRGFLSSFIGFAGESNYNWVHMVYFGEGNEVVSEQHQYFDGFGRATQSQVKNIDENLVLAQQNVYDANGAASLQTLYAPIGNAFAYKSNFITPNSSSSIPYSYSNFDASSKYFNPDAVYSSTANTLGHYYSNSGPENYISTTTYPFARTYSNGNMVFSSAAGSDHKMGSNHESKAIALVAGNELNTYLYDVDSLFKVKYSDTDPFILSQYNGTIKAVKSINVDSDGKEAITYTANGLTLATCISGLSNEAENLTGVTYQFPVIVGKHPNTGSTTYDYTSLNYIDLHIPKNKNGTLVLSKLQYSTIFNPPSWQDATYSTHYSYSFFDMQTGTALVENTDYTLNQSTWAVSFIGSCANKTLFLRVFINYTGAGLSLGYLKPPTVTQSLDYGQWTLNYYDLSGQLLRSVTPKGVDISNPGIFKQYCNSYAYSNLGQIVRSKSPDAGIAEMVYNNEGQLRFSQNAEQKQNNRFSYINYDVHGRVVETGEYYSNNNNYNFQNYYNNSTIFETCGTCLNTNTVLNNLDGLADGDCYNEYKTWYGKLQSTDEIPSGYTYKSQYTQKYVQGQVTRISNENSIMWFGYDQLGRTAFTVEQITEPLYISIKTNIDDQIKTTNYSYNLQNGLLGQYVYNTNGTDKLTHAYTYSKAGALKNAAISINGGNTQNVAKYYYYTNGALKRAELGGTLQGVDYVYTLHGQLKSINNPWQDATKDPGTDGQAGTSHAIFASDLFSYGLDYFSGDYVRNNTYITSTANGSGNYYSGLVSAQRYRYNYAAACSVQTGGANYQLISPANKYEQFIKQFTYDELNRLATATLGKYDQQTPSTTTFTEYKEFGGSGSIAYDANSNITNLKRNAYNKSSNYDYHNLTYTYDTINNKLKEVTDVSGVNGYVGTSAFDTSGTRAFTYTALGQLKSSSAEHIDTAYYYPDGKTKRVKYSSGNYVNYYYNCTNQLMRTTSYEGSTSNHTWYVYSASGALQAVYKKEGAGSFTLTEQPVYAGGRIGVVDRAHSNEIIYHLSDHLGNTRMAFKNNGSGQPSVTMYADYYAFGGLMPGRFNNNVTGGANNTNTYQYQGQQKDPQANWSQFELRMFNNDLGRWFAPDPYNQFASPYNGMGNHPTNLIDPDGGYTYTGGEAYAMQKMLNDRHRRMMVHDYWDDYAWMYEGAAYGFNGGGGTGGGLSGGGIYGPAYGVDGYITQMLLDGMSSAEANSFLNSYQDNNMQYSSSEGAMTITHWASHGVIDTYTGHTNADNTQANIFKDNKDWNRVHSYNSYSSSPPGYLAAFMKWVKTVGRFKAKDRYNIKGSHPPKYFTQGPFVLPQEGEQFNTFAIPMQYILPAPPATAVGIGPVFNPLNQPNMLWGTTFTNSTGTNNIQNHIANMNGLNIVGTTYNVISFNHMGNDIGVGGASTIYTYNSSNNWFVNISGQAATIGVNQLGVLPFKVMLNDVGGSAIDIFNFTIIGTPNAFGFDQCMGYRIDGNVVVTVKVK